MTHLPLADLRENSDGAQPFPIMSGRDIYNHRSLTGQNRSPIQDLKSYALAGQIGGENAPFDSNEACERLLVDGPFVTIGGIPVEDVWARDETFFIQYQRIGGVLDFKVKGDDLTKVVADHWREFQLDEDGLNWSSALVEFDFQGKESKRTAGPSYKATDVYVFPNDRGILYYPQEAFWLLEENKETQRDLMRGSNVMPIVDSDQDPSTWKTALNTARRMIIGQYDKITPPAASQSVMAALKTEADDARADWLDALNTIEKDAPQRPSGADREIRSRAMVNFVRTLRDDIETVFKAFGDTISFNERVITAAPADRMAEYELIKLLQTDGALTPEEATKRKQNLA